jgi:hypothetical protein
VGDLVVLDSAMAIQDPSSKRWKKLRMSWAQTPPSKALMWLGPRLEQVLADPGPLPAASMLGPQQEPHHVLEPSHTYPSVATLCTAQTGVLQTGQLINLGKGPSPPRHHPPSSLQTS